MGIQSCLKGYDNYGHVIQFNFKRKGETVNTSLGGCVSILVNVFVYGFFIMRMMTMINKQNNDLSERESFVTVEEVGEHKLSELNILFYFVFFSTGIQNFLEQQKYDANSIADYMEFKATYTHMLEG